MTYREVLERRTGLKLAKATKNEVNKIYFCGYWKKTYKVLAVKKHDIWDEVYQVQWEDGRIGTHFTRFDPKNDFEVIGGIAK